MSDSVMEIDKWGDKFWINSKGQPHRTDGPAIEHSNGSKEWYMDGKWHRTNGPACEWECGTKSWYVNNEFLGFNDKGFWALWDTLTPEQRQNSNLLEYLPENFSV